MEDLLSLDRAPQVGGPRPLHSFLHSEKPFRIFFPPTINLKKIKKEKKKKKKKAQLAQCPCILCFPDTHVKQGQFCLNQS